MIHQKQKDGFVNKLQPSGKNISSSLGRLSWLKSDLFSNQSFSHIFSFLFHFLVLLFSKRRTMMIGTHTTSDMRPALFWDCTLHKIQTRGRFHLHHHRSLKSCMFQTYFHNHQLNTYNVSIQLLYKGVDNTDLFSANPGKQVFGRAPLFPFLLTLVTNLFSTAQTLEKII